MDDLAALGLDRDPDAQLLAQGRRPRAGGEDHLSGADLLGAEREARDDIVSDQQSLDVRLPQIALPLGSYAGWNLRRPEVGAPDKLARWSGSFIPFARTEAERRAAGDPRPSLAARYGSREDYENRIEGAARQLVEAGFLLDADVLELTRRAGAFYDRLVAHDPNDPSCAYQLDD